MLLLSSTSTQIPKIVKTTTKQIITQNADGLQHNREEKVEDLTPGGSGAVTVVSSINKVIFIFSDYLIVLFQVQMTIRQFLYF